MAQQTEEQKKQRLVIVEAWKQFGMSEAEAEIATDVEITYAEEADIDWATFEFRGAK